MSNARDSALWTSADGHCLAREVVELSLLLPGWQALALETTARGRGMTAGQMLRSIVGEFFSKFARPPSGPDFSVTP